MWSQFPPNLSRYSCVVVSVFLLWFLPNLSCLQNNPPENNVEQFPPNLSCLQNNPPENNVVDLAGTRFTLFSSRLIWDWFLLDLRSFFVARFRYKLMYYYFYHRSDLRENIQFLCKIECIKFECNEFVLVLVQIVLIHFEHSICISSTLIKTNTNPTTVPAKSELPPNQSAGKWCGRFGGNLFHIIFQRIVLGLISFRL
jgi:hypothetical protein